LSWALFRPLLPGIVIGIVLGSLLLGVVSERGIQALIGLMGFWVLAQRRWPWLAGRGVNLQGAAAFSLGGIGGVGSTLAHAGAAPLDRKSTRLNSSHVKISCAVCCVRKKNEPVS